MGLRNVIALIWLIIAITAIVAVFTLASDFVIPNTMHPSGHGRVVEF